MRGLVISSLSVLVTALVIAMPVSAGGNTVSFTDPQGDMTKDRGWNSNSVWQGPAYLDIRAGSLTVKGSTITVVVVVDGPIVGNLPDGAKTVYWAWAFSMDGVGMQYALFVGWDGQEFVSFLWTNGAPTITISDFTVASTIVTVSLDKRLVEGSVAWISVTCVVWHPMEMGYAPWWPWTDPDWNGVELWDASWMPMP